MWTSISSIRWNNFQDSSNLSCSQIVPLKHGSEYSRPTTVIGKLDRYRIRGSILSPRHVHIVFRTTSLRMIIRGAPHHIALLEWKRAGIAPDLSDPAFFAVNASSTPSMVGCGPGLIIRTCLIRNSTRISTRKMSKSRPGPQRVWFSLPRVGWGHERS